MAICYQVNRVRIVWDCGVIFFIRVRHRAELLQRICCETIFFNPVFKGFPGPEVANFL